jgi:hypothetical protein
MPGISGMPGEALLGMQGEPWGGIDEASSCEDEERGGE